MAELHYLIPHHTEGAETDITYTITADMIEEAEDMFVDAKNRLLNVSLWDVYAGINNVHFALADAHKHSVSRNARNADHILINPKGISSTQAEYDAYTIDALEYDDYPDTNLETFAIRMHPSIMQAATLNKSNTATVIIVRRGRQISATYHGRNNTSGLTDLWHGLRNTDWEAILKGLIEYYD